MYSKCGSRQGCQSCFCQTAREECSSLDGHGSRMCKGGSSSTLPLQQRYASTPCRDVLLACANHIERTVRAALSSTKRSILRHLRKTPEGCAPGSNDMESRDSSEQHTAILPTVYSTLPIHSCLRAISSNSPIYPSQLSFWKWCVPRVLSLSPTT